MNGFRFRVLVVGVLSGALPPSAPVGRQPLYGPPGNVHRLVQSELDYLPAAERPITLEVANAEPAAVLQKIREQSGLVIDVQGSLPNRPMLSASYRDTKTKVVLEWFAQQVPLSFRAEPPSKLWIVIDSRGKRVPAKDAS